MNPDTAVHTAGRISARPVMPALIGVALRVATAAALIIDAVVT